MSKDERRHDADAAHRLGCFIYGAIVTLAVVIDSAHASNGAVGRVAFLVVVTSLTFWLAHVYSHSLGQSVARKERPSRDELVGIGRREWPIVEASALPVVALVLGAIGVISPDTSYWLAIAAGVGVLVSQGFRFARTARLGALGTSLVVGTNVAFGLVLVGLKLLVMH
jgi:hypothetical protein